MLLSRGAGVKGTKISALAGLRIFLPGIEAILAGLQLSNHNDNLLHCHRLCQIPWLIDVAAASDGNVVSQELEWNDRENWREQIARSGNFDHMIRNN